MPGHQIKGLYGRCLHQFISMPGKTSHFMERVFPEGMVVIGYELFPHGQIPGPPQSLKQSRRH